MRRPISIIGAPTSAGAHAGGQELAPAALRQAGLVSHLRGAGLEVVDRGDITTWRWRPDRAHPRAQNLEHVVSGIREVAAQVEAVRRERRFALVLGGDCTIELGTVLGHLRAGNRVGLLYFDMHADMNVPSSVPGGALDWMGVAHMLGCPGAEGDLAELAGAAPMLRPGQVLVFGHRLDQATAFERDEIRRLSVTCIPIEQVAADPAAAACRALTHFQDPDPIAVHFDVDVIDFTDAPLSENTGRNIGLKHDTALAALERILHDPRVSALTVTELNPEHGEPEGITVRAFSNRLAQALAGSGTPRAGSA